MLETCRKQGCHPQPALSAVHAPACFWLPEETPLVERYLPWHFRAEGPTGAANRLNLYERAELRALIGNRILSVDQKVIHGAVPVERVMRRKRAHYQMLTAMLQEQTGHPIDGIVQSSGDVRTELLNMKTSLLPALRLSALAEEGLPWVSRSPDSETTRFPYVQSLCALFGENLQAICLYGSACVSDNPSDYDNYVVVRDLPLAYRQASKFSGSCHGRPVHLNLLPADSAGALLLAASSPTVRPETLKVLHGTLQLPVCPTELIVAQGWVRALDLLQRRRGLLRSDLAMVYESVKALPAKSGQDAFRSLTQLPAVMVYWAMAYEQAPKERPLPKKKVVQLLKDQGHALPEIGSDGTLPPPELWLSGIRSAERLIKNHTVHSHS